MVAQRRLNFRVARTGTAAGPPPLHFTSPCQAVPLLAVGARCGHSPQGRVRPPCSSALLALPGRDPGAAQAQASAAPSPGLQHCRAAEAMTVNQTVTVLGGLLILNQSPVVHISNSYPFISHSYPIRSPHTVKNSWCVAIFDGAPMENHG